MRASSPQLLLDNQLCFALYRASRAVIRAYTPLLAPLGLTYLQYLVMLVLWEQNNLSVKVIGERLALDSATLTPLLKKLEASKLISRKRDKVDERIVRILLTDIGADLAKKASSIPSSLVCKGGFDVSQQETLKKISDLRDELHKLADSYSSS